MADKKETENPIGLREIPIDQHSTSRWRQQDIFNRPEAATHLACHIITSCRAGAGRQRRKQPKSSYLIFNKTEAVIKSIHLSEDTLIYGQSIRDQSFTLTCGAFDGSLYLCKIRRRGFLWRNTISAFI